MFGKPLGGKFAQGEAEALGGEIGAAGFFRDEKAAELDDEFESLGTADRILADHRIAVLEVPCGGAPDEHGDDVAILQDELAEPVAVLAARAEGVLFVEHLVGDLPICGCGGDSDVKWFADRAVRAYG